MTTLKTTAVQLRAQAKKIIDQAQYADGQAFHKQMQEVQHLLIQAEALDNQVKPVSKQNSPNVTAEAQQRKKDLAQIHVLAKKLDMDDDTYRDMLERLTGKRSTAQLKGTERFKVIKHLQANVPQSNRKHHSGVPNNIASNVQLQKIEALLAEAKYPWSYAKAISQRMYKKTQLEFCDVTELSGIINALIKDAKKHGRRLG